MEPKTPPPSPSVTMTADQFNQLIDAVKSNGSGDQSALLQLVEAQNRTVRRSNAYTEGKSPFSYPEGEEVHPKPRLDRETWFCATRQDESMLTPDEIIAFNSVTVSKTWRGDPKYGADVSPKRRFIMLPHISIDERMGLPSSLPMVMRELVEGPDAINPANLLEEVMALKAKVAQLETPAPDKPSMAAF